MKKTSKFFGTIALTAALALGTAVPAFAEVTEPSSSGSATNKGTIVTTISDGQLKYVENTEGEDPDENAIADGNSTVVTVSTYTSQISIALPMVLPVAADTAGGYGVAPNGYYIENNSSVPVEITKATYGIASGATSEWTFGENALTVGSNPLRISGTADAASPKLPTMGSLYMTIGNDDITDLELKARNVAETATAEQTQGIKNNAPVLVQDNLKWGIGAATTNNKGEITAGKLALNVSVSSSRLSSAYDSTTPTTVANIIYTVGLPTA